MPGSRGKAALCGLTVGLLGLLSRPASGSDFKAHFVVQHDTELVACPTAAQLAEQVGRIVGRPVLEVSATPVAAESIAVHIRQLPEAIIAEVRTAAGQVRHVRVAPEHGCEQLAEVLPFTLALIVDSIEWKRMRERAAREVSPPPSPPAPQPQPAASGWTPALQLGGMGSVGLLHGLSGGAFADLELRTHRGHTLGAGLLLAVQPSYEYAGGRIGLGLYALSIRGCVPLAGSESLGLLACLMPTAGVIHVTAAGYATNEGASRPWVGVGSDLLLRGRIAGAWEWSTRAGALTTLHADSFVVSGAGTAHDPSRICGYAALGAGVHFH